MANFPTWLRRGQWVWSHERFAFFTLCCPTASLLRAEAVCSEYPPRIHAYPGLLDDIDTNDSAERIYEIWIKMSEDMPTLDYRQLQPIPRDFFERKDNEDE